MNCTICKEPTENGRIINGQIICNSCQVSDMVKKIAVKKDPKESTMIIQVLKHYGVRGDVAKGLYDNPAYSIERIIKTVWLFRYIESTNYKIISNRAFMMTLLTYECSLSEKFWYWYKNEMKNPRKNDFPILYRNI